jgi:hypothetical protein
MPNVADSIRSEPPRVNGLNTSARQCIIAGAPPTRFACGREKQVSRLTKCPIEILNLRVIPTKKRVAFGPPCYTIHQFFHAQSFYNRDTLI